MDSFREEYRTKFGREPYVNPVTRFRWFVRFAIYTFIGAFANKYGGILRSVSQAESMLKE
jgi:hypothetical protein